jgi:hypothetical protein
MRKKRIPWKIVLCSLMVLLGVSVLPNAWADPVIYSQPPDSSGGLIGSQNNAYTTYDDFTLDSPFTVTDVHWRGGYYDSPPGTIDSFTIQFYSNNAGQPGGSLFSETILGNAGETYVGIEGGRNSPIYDYSVNLILPFTETAGTYWLSIQANKTSIPPQWGWHIGTGGDGVSYQQDSWDLTRWSEIFDLAFDLTGTAAAVPEPSTMLLLGSGLIGLWGFRKKFKN